MEKELSYLGKAMTNPARPFARFPAAPNQRQDLKYIENLMKIADVCSSAAAWLHLPQSRRPAHRQVARRGRQSWTSRGACVPKRNTKNCTAASCRSRRRAEFKADTTTQTVSVSATPDGGMGLDYRSQNHRSLSSEHCTAKTIVWNVPWAYEMPAFSKGTLEIAKSVAAATSAGATSIVGGGDSVGSHSSVRPSR